MKVWLLKRENIYRTRSKFAMVIFVHNSPSSNCPTARSGATSLITVRRSGAERIYGEVDRHGAGASTDYA